jgi:hypothetical protein
MALAAICETSRRSRSATSFSRTSTRIGKVGWQPSANAASFQSGAATHASSRSRFLADGFRAIVVCVDPRLLDRSFAGREYDEPLPADLPPNVDLCGENGKFHTFGYAGADLRLAAALQARRDRRARRLRLLRPSRAIVGLDAGPGNDAIDVPGSAGYINCGPGNDIVTLHGFTRDAQCERDFLQGPRHCEGVYFGDITAPQPP